MNVSSISPMVLSALALPAGNPAQASEQDFNGVVAERFVADCIEAGDDSQPKDSEIVEVKAISYPARTTFLGLRPGRNDKRSTLKVYQLKGKGAFYLGRYTNGHPTGWEYTGGCTLLADSVEFETLKQRLLTLTAGRGMTDMAFLGRLYSQYNARADSPIWSEGTAASGAQKDRLARIFVLASSDHSFEIFGSKLSNRTTTLTFGKLGKLARKQAALDWKQHLARQSDDVRH